MSDVNNLGIGVMIGLLCGNEETVSSIKSSLGKTISEVELRDEHLQFVFTDNSKLEIWDDGQSCCEHRYMVTVDNLKEHWGKKLMDFELKTAPNEACDYGDHEIQFLDVKTDGGVFQLASHNEHNGYYGGFLIRAKFTPAESEAA